MKFRTPLGSVLALFFAAGAAYAADAVVQRGGVVDRVETVVLKEGSR